MKPPVLRQQSKEETTSLHPNWLELIELCQTMGYGEIERLKIQDGLPVFLERVTEKIKLA